MKILFGILGFLIILSTTSADLQCGNGLELANQTRWPLLEFSRNLYKKIAVAKPDKNIVFSPVSIALALALVESGSSGETQTELKKILAPRNQTSHSVEVSQLYESLQKLLQTGTENANLTIANALFGGQDFAFKPKYQQRASSCYDAKVDKVNFKNKAQAVQKINTWVADATSQRITRLLSANDIHDDTQAVLTNAIYLKATWTKKFRVLDDQVDFYRFGRDNDKQRVSFMGRVDRYSYVADNDFRMVRIPYADGLFIFTLLLPKERNGMEAVEQQLNPAKFRSLRDRWASTRLDLRIPKFSIRMPIKLKEILQEIGLKKIFTDAADLSRLSDQSLKVDKVIHEAFIKVNENGTEAAAATAVIGIRTMSLETDTAVPIPFIVDHPFTFSISHRDTNSMIFMGKVNFIEAEDAN